MRQAPGSGPEAPRRAADPAGAPAGSSTTGSTGASTTGSTGLAAATAAVCLIAAVLLAAPEARATRERPPSAQTGGFGEPTCHACHFDSDLNSGAGRLTLRGLPPEYEPGRTYTLTVLLVEPGLSAAGFQLAVRYQDGRQAGALAPGAGEARRVDVSTDRNIQYAHHIYDGTFPASTDTARWTVAWTAPAGPPEPIIIHLVANAADDDSSALGDFIYAGTFRAR